jgi:general L-amino acid transport system substrate-binding protein
MFSAPYLFTGNGIMVYKSLGVTKGTDLDGATICTDRRHHAREGHRRLLRQEQQEVQAPHVRERQRARPGLSRQALRRDGERLRTARGRACVRRSERGGPRHPAGRPRQRGTGRVVRQGDDKFLNVVNWTIFALIERKSSGITQANVDAKKSDPDPRVQKLLGGTQPVSARSSACARLGRTT